MEATQESTQPYADPRRVGSHNSGLDEQDAADIICILHPNSRAAHDAVAATARIAPQHILQRNELEYENSSTSALDIALRLSSSIRDIGMGFCFGRNKARCDVLLSPDDSVKRISNIHFRIYLTRDGILMLQDTSTNGTVVDNYRLHKQQKDTSRMLTGGSIINVVACTAPTDEVRFVVRIPSRDNCNVAYTENLIQYFQRVQLHAPANNARPEAVGAPTQVALPLAVGNPYGMHWSGGSLYNVTGQIGKGAFATVYKLATKQHGVVYAAKELDKRRFMKNGILDQKVDNEMKIMRGLRHPNIVRYEDYHDHERWIYIIMEYVPGGELSNYLGHRGKIPENIVKSITRQILHALHYLHKRKITHRDIKPDNILIASFDPLRVKLSDFGLSKVAQDETFLKTFCGTLLYCAPEVYPEYENYRKGEARKRRRLGDPPIKTSPYDQSVDMWSLGALLYHILCGTPPFAGRGDKPVQMLRTIMTANVNMDLLRCEGVSKEGIDFVSKLLNRDPASRPKERECFKHPWIAAVPDIDEYSEDESTSDGELDIIRENAEDDLDASRLSIQDNINLEDNAPGSSEFQPKRQRLDEVEIRYPSLPNMESFPVTKVRPPRMNRGRLFGEVSKSAFRSSGVLDGSDCGAFDRVDNASFSSFVSSSDELVDNSHNLAIPTSLPDVFGGSAPSLLGAERLVGQLRMSSSNAGPLELVTPAVDTPATPGSPGHKVLTPANEAFSELNPTHQNPHEATPKAFQFTRRIELPLPDTSSESSRDQDPVDQADNRKANLQHDLDAELAVTVDARTGREVSRFPSTSDSLGDELTEYDGRIYQPSTRILAPSKFTKPRPLLGKLTTLPGSIFDLTIRLEDRMTSWGRGPLATICYQNPLDTRIPVYALEVTFWTPGIESRIASGDDWMIIPNVMAILSTKTRRCVWVNGVELRRGPDRESSREGFHFGTLYSGDIITVYQHRDQYLKFRCDFYHGDSARPRPENEKDFIVRKALTPKANSRENRQPSPGNNGGKGLGEAKGKEKCTRSYPEAADGDF